MSATSFAPEVEEEERAEAFEEIDIHEEDESERPKVSAARLRANRENAKKSTGPKTVAGKNRSRENALKHGLTGEAIVLVEEDELDLEDEVEKWAEELHPNSDIERGLVKNLVVASRRLDRLQKMDSTMRIEQARRARGSWDQDRRAEVAKIAAKLAKSPFETVARLEQTPQGCDWMITCWKDLGNALEVKGDWTDPQRSLALDLLGTHPATRDCSLELPLDATFEDKCQVVAERLDYLEELRDEILAELDEEERVDTMKGNVFDTSDGAERFRRYEGANIRLFFRLLHHFQGRIRSPKRRSEPIRDHKEESVPAPAPASKPKPIDLDMANRALAALAALRAGQPQPSAAPSVSPTVSVSQPVSQAEPEPQSSRPDRRARRSRNRRR